MADGGWREGSGEREDEIANAYKVIDDGTHETIVTTSFGL